MTTNDGRMLISMPDLNEDFSDRVARAAVISLTNPAVVTPGTDDAPPAVVIKSVDVRNQAGTFPHKFVIEVQVLDDRGIDKFAYRARIDGRERPSSPGPRPSATSPVGRQVLPSSDSA
jgi:hypothetical protein